jgi:ATP-dependent Lon protease
MELDALDLIATKAFEGFVVRKDLVRRFKGQYPVPTYVGEFLLGRYCASTNESEIKEGLEIVQRQLESRTVRAGEEELFKARAKQEGKVKLIDIITARLDVKNDCFVAELPSLRLKNIRIKDQFVKDHERMLTGGFYAEIELLYDPSIAEEENGRPFGVEFLREIQLSKRDVLETLSQGRKLFTFEEWQFFLLRSIGLEPAVLTPRTRDAMLLRMVPFVENNFNAVELGPRGTGKSHLFQQISP